MEDKNITRMQRKETKFGRDQPLIFSPLVVQPRENAKQR